jgi:predicted phage-related endonuclease
MRNSLEVEVRSVSDRATWQSWRHQDVTASVFAAVPRFACHPYVTPLRLFVEKSGVEFPEQDNKVLRRGRWLEPAVAKAVSELRPDWELQAADVYLRSPQHRLGATPDFFIHGDPRGLGVLQCKSVAPLIYTRDWLGGSELPLWIELQARTEMMLARTEDGDEAAFGAVAALLVDPFNMDAAILELQRDAQIEAQIIAAVDAFWADVAAGREPDPDFEQDRAAIEALRPHELPGKTLDLSGNNYVAEMLDQRADLLRRIKADEARCEAVENELRFLAGDAETITGIDGFKITYKTINRKAFTVPASSKRGLRIYDRREKERAL